MRKIAAVLALIGALIRLALAIPKFLLYWAGLGCVLAGLGIVGDQILQWLRFGNSQGFPISKLLKLLRIQVPSTDWIGLQQIADWLLAIHASVLLLMAAGIFAFAYFLFDEVQAQLELKTRQRAN